MTTDAGPTRNEQIQAQFTARAPIYDGSAAWISDPGLIQTFVDMCRMPASSVLLDVCCGTGLVGGAFRGRVARLVGVDLTEEMLEAARARLDECHQGRAEALPFADASFDIVTCRQAVHFVENPAAVVREMGRVLKPGGQLILGHRVPYGPEDAGWWEKVNRKKQPLIRNLLLDQDVRGFVREAGFADVFEQEYFLWESIPRWLDSPEARQGSVDVFELYRSAPPEAIRVRQIQILENEIRDCWRWLIVSGFRPS